MPSQYLFFKGRVALYALLRAFGVGRGHRVLLPGYTCVVVPFAVRYLDSIPEYADIDVDSYNSLLHHYVTAYQRLEKGGTAQSLKAVIIQHTYGNPNRDTARIVAWARDKGLIVIEDCAHCHGVMIDGHAVGTFGDAAFFSFQWSKPFTTGLGGSAVIRDSEQEGVLAALHGCARDPSLRVRVSLAAQVLAYECLLHPRVYWFAINAYRCLSHLGVAVGSSRSGELQGNMPADYFQRMGRFQERLLNRRIAEADMLKARRIRLAAMYDQFLEREGMPTFRRESGAVLIRYPVRVKDRDACVEAARERRVELGNWFNHPLHPAGSNIGSLNWDDKPCPTSVCVAKEVVTLPLYSRITDHEAKRTADFLASWWQKMGVRDSRSVSSEESTTALAAS